MGFSFGNFLVVRARVQMNIHSRIAFKLREQMSAVCLPNTMQIITLLWCNIWICFLRHTERENEINKTNIHTHFAPHVKSWIRALAHLLAIFSWSHQNLFFFFCFCFFLWCLIVFVQCWANLEETSWAFNIAISISTDYLLVTLCKQTIMWLQTKCPGAKNVRA